MSPSPVGRHPCVPPPSPTCVRQGTRALPYHGTHVLYRIPSTVGGGVLDAPRNLSVGADVFVRPHIRTPSGAFRRGRRPRRPARIRSILPYMVYTNGSEGFFITGAGVAAATRVPLRTEWVKNTLPPTTEPSPMSVSPPRIDAPE